VAKIVSASTNPEGGGLWAINNRQSSREEKR